MRHQVALALFRLIPRCSQVFFRFTRRKLVRLVTVSRESSLCHRLCA